MRGTATGDDAAAYLRAALAVDPGMAPAELLELRAGHLGLEPDPARAESAGRIRRDEATDLLADIAAQLWQDAPAAVRARLDQLELSAYPDLAAWHRQLRTADALRTEFDLAEADRRVDRELTAVLRELAVAPDAAQPGVRDRFLTTRTNRRTLRHGSRRLRRAHTHLAQLDPALLASIDRVAHEHRARARRRLMIGLVVLYFAARGLVQVFEQ